MHEITYRLNDSALPTLKAMSHKRQNKLTSSNNCYHVIKFEIEKIEILVG